MCQKANSYCDKNTENYLFEKCGEIAGACIFVMKLMNRRTTINEVS